MEWEGKLSGMNKNGRGIVQGGKMEGELSGVGKWKGNCPGWENGREIVWENDKS